MNVFVGTLNSVKLVSINMIFQMSLSEIEVIFEKNFMTLYAKHDVTNATRTSKDSNCIFIHVYKNIICIQAKDRFALKP